MSSKTLELPFAYEAEVVPYRKRTPLRKVVRDTMLIAVPVLAGDDFPVAVRHRGGREYRSFEGRIHIRMSGPGDLSPEAFQAAVTDPDWITRPRGRVWDGNGFPILPVLKKGTFGQRYPMHHETAEEIAEELLAEGGAPRWKWSDRDERRAEAAELYSRSFAVFDGAMWAALPDGEPCNVVSVVQRRVKLSQAFYPATPASAYSVFRLDRSEEARTFAREVFAGQEGFSREIEEPQFEVVDASLLTRDDVVIVARQLLAGMPEPRGGWPVGVNVALEQVAPLRRAGISTIPEIAAVVRAAGVLRALDGDEGAPAEWLENSRLAWARWRLEEPSASAVAAAVRELEADDDAIAMGM